MEDHREPISRGQGHELLNKLEAAGLVSFLAQRIIDSKGNELATRIVNLVEDGRSAPSLVHVERRENLALERFVGESLGILMGEENARRDWRVTNSAPDVRTENLVEFDFEDVHLVTMLRQHEMSISGEEKQKRLKESHYILLDANVFLTIWYNKHCIPERWKKKLNGNTRYIVFDGTIFRSPDNKYCVLRLYWRDGAWCWDCVQISNGQDIYSLSAVLAA